MSLLVCETPWKPATIGIAPPSSAVAIRPGVTSMMRALPCVESVITPACEPVNDWASRPRLAIAIASSAIDIRSPAVSSMSSSRPGGSGLTRLAKSVGPSVVSPIAETDHDDMVTGLARGDDPLRYPLDAIRVGHRRATVFLHDKSHGAAAPHGFCGQGTLGVYPGAAGP